MARGVFNYPVQQSKFFTNLGELCQWYLDLEKKGFCITIGVFPRTNRKGYEFAIYRKLTALEKKEVKKGKYEIVDGFLQSVKKPLNRTAKPKLRVKCICGRCGAPHIRYDCESNSFCKKCRSYSKNNTSSLD